MASTSAAERRAKIEKLKRDRLAKEKERAEKAQAAASQVAAQDSTDKLISQILENTKQQNMSLEAQDAGMTLEEVK
jgi:hypothetical protein